MCFIVINNTKLYIIYIRKSKFFSFGPRYHFRVLYNLWFNINHFTFKTCLKPKYTSFFFFFVSVPYSKPQYLCFQVVLCDIWRCGPGYGLGVRLYNECSSRNVRVDFRGRVLADDETWNALRKYRF